MWCKMRTHPYTLGLWSSRTNLWVVFKGPKRRQRVSRGTAAEDVQLLDSTELSKNAATTLQQCEQMERELRMILVPA